jgi:hypothetical protein
MPSSWSCSLHSYYCPLQILLMSNSLPPPSSHQPNFFLVFMCSSWLFYVLLMSLSFFSFCSIVLFLSSSPLHCLFLSPCLFSWIILSSPSSFFPPHALMSSSCPSHALMSSSCLARPLLVLLMPSCPLLVLDVLFLSFTCPRVSSCPGRPLFVLLVFFSCPSCPLIVLLMSSCPACPLLVRFLSSSCPPHIFLLMPSCPLLVSGVLFLSF